MLWSVSKMVTTNRLLNVTRDIIDHLGDGMYQLDVDGNNKYILFQKFNLNI